MTKTAIGECQKISNTLRNLSAYKFSLRNSFRAVDCPHRLVLRIKFFSHAGTRNDFLKSVRVRVFPLKTSKQRVF